MDTQVIPPEFDLEADAEHRRLQRQLPRIYQMYQTYCADHEDGLAFEDYAWLFHEIPRDIAHKWKTTGVW